MPEPFVPYQPEALGDSHVVHDPFWDDLKPNAESDDLQDLLIHRVNISRPAGKLSETSGATLAGTVADALLPVQAEVPCCVEELSGQEQENYARRTIVATHNIYFGYPFPDIQFDDVINYVNDRILRVVDYWDDGGEGQGVVLTALCKEQ